MERNAGQVARYVEHVWPKLERSGSIPDVPFDRKHKGESNSPVGNHALDVMGENWGPPGSKKRAVFQFLRAELDAIECGGNNRRSEDDVPFSQILQAVRYDAGVVRHWRKGETAGQIQGAKAFWDVCRYVAIILQMHFDDEDGPLYLEVTVQPEDEEARAKTRKAQVADTRYRQRLMIEQLEQVEEETGYSGRMAMEILSERKAKEIPSKDWSVRKLKDARTFVNKERAMGDVA